LALYKILLSSQQATSFAVTLFCIFVLCPWIFFPGELIKPTVGSASSAAPTQINNAFLNQLKKLLVFTFFLNIPMKSSEKYTKHSSTNVVEYVSQVKCTIFRILSFCQSEFYTIFVSLLF
jgi:hypothetical protein